MFERLKGLWNTIVGNRAESAGDERRVWVRHPSQMQTLVAAVADGADTRHPARVGNVSRGGIHLLVDRAFQPGDMISIDLPGDINQGDETLLACVVHVTELPGGQWGLGCAFSETVEDDTLAALGARSGPNQRAAVRFPCLVQAVYTRASTSGSEPRPAEVRNVSANGIGLVLPEAVEAGTLLNVTLTGEHGGRVGSILACVVHVSHRPGADWVVGCNFIRELSEDDLAELA